ncbi:MAG: TolB family protein [Candidatus Flexifilum sp.]
MVSLGTRQPGRGRIVALMILLAALAFSGPGLHPAAAQGGSFAAFVNPSGQLIVSDTTGGYRWIVTYPGEMLAAPIGYTWSPAGDRLLFAINLGAEISLRVGSVATQSVIEIGRLPAGSISGGVWTPDGSGVFAASNDQIAYFDASGGGSAVLIAGGGPVTLISPYASDRPYLPRESSLSPDGRFLFYQTGDGRYVTAALDGSAVYPLAGANDSAARGSGLWADGAPLVAYWGYEATALLSVTHAATGATLTLDSGRAAPITPLAWFERAPILVYRDVTGFVRAADVGCLLSACGDNPLLAGVEFMPPTAADVQIISGYGIYRDGVNVYAVPTTCIFSGGCGAQTVLLAANAVPGLPIHAAGGRLAYTAFSADPNNPADRSATVVDLTCLNTGACGGQPLISGALAGLLADDGRSLIVDGPGGLSIVSLTGGTTVSLSDYSGGALLLTARWN